MHEGPTHRPFTAGGPSPNPRGRPLGAQEVQNRALALCNEAIDTLAGIMRGKAVDKSIVSAQLAQFDPDELLALAEYVDTDFGAELSCE